MTTLWRVHDKAHPHFGRGSYWAFSDKLALQVGTFFLRAGLPGPLRLYTVDVDQTNVLDLRRPFRLIPSTDVEAVSAKVASRLGREAFEWVIFYEGSWEGDIAPQALYLGDEPLPAVGVRDVLPPGE